MRNIHAKISDEDIVTLLRQRNKQGISSLYANYSRLLYGVIFRIVKRQDLAENVLQDVFLKVWQSIETYDVSKGRFIAWVMNIARNASIDMVRSKNYRKDMVTDGVEAAVAQPASTVLNVEHIGVKEVVNKLEPKYRQLIDLLYFEGYTQSEVSEELDIPLGTVKSRVRKAFSELRTLLQ